MHDETLERQIRRRLQPALPVRQAPDHLFVSLLGEARGLMHGHDEHRILLVSESRRPILTAGWRWEPRRGRGARSADGSRSTRAGLPYREFMQRRPGLDPWCGSTEGGATELGQLWREM